MDTTDLKVKSENINKDKDNLDVEKYKHLYEHTLKGYYELSQIDKNLEEKAWKFFTALTLLLGFQIYFLNILKEVKISNYQQIDWVILIFALLTFSTLSYNWFLIFNVVKTKPYKNLPMEDNVIKYYDDNKLITIYYNSSIQLIDLYKDNTINYQYKTKKLKTSIYFLKHNSLFIIVEIILLLIKYIING